MKNKKWFNPKWWMYIAVCFIILTMIFFVGYRTKANEVNDMKKAVNQFSMDDYMQKQYVENKIPLDTYLKYKHEQADVMFKFVIGLAAVFVGLGTLFHGFQLIDARHHYKEDEEI